MQMALSMLPVVPINLQCPSCERFPSIANFHFIRRSLKTKVEKYGILWYRDTCKQTMFTPAPAAAEMRAVIRSMIAVFCSANGLVVGNTMAFWIRPTRTLRAGRNCSSSAVNSNAFPNIPIPKTFWWELETWVPVTTTPFFSNRTLFPTHQLPSGYFSLWIIKKDVWIHRRMILFKNFKGISKCLLEHQSLAQLMQMTKYCVKEVASRLLHDYIHIKLDSPPAFLISISHERIYYHDQILNAFHKSIMLKRKTIKSCHPSNFHQILDQKISYFSEESTPHLCTHKIMPKNQTLMKIWNHRKNKTLMSERPKWQKGKFLFSKVVLQIVPKGFCDVRNSDPNSTF